jgi:hypothetical protein
MEVSKVLLAPLANSVLRRQENIASCSSLFEEQSCPPSFLLVGVVDQYRARQLQALESTVPLIVPLEA